jgi:hypothetical protein
MNHCAGHVHCSRIVACVVTNPCMGHMLTYVHACHEQKAHGDDSELHIIIFDEIDAICKQRGSSRDGTGVGVRHRPCVDRRALRPFVTWEETGRGGGGGGLGG